MTTLTTTNIFDYIGSIVTVTVGTAGSHEITADSAPGGEGYNSHAGGFGAMASGGGLFAGRRHIRDSLRRGGPERELWAEAVSSSKPAAVRAPSATTKSPPVNAASLALAPLALAPIPESPEA
jgi:hypothetical protein